MAHQEGNMDDHSTGWTGDHDDHTYWLDCLSQLQDSSSPQNQGNMPVTSADANFDQFLTSPTPGEIQFTTHQEHSTPLYAMNPELDLGPVMGDFTNPPPAPMLPQELLASTSTVPTSANPSTMNSSSSQPLDMPGSVPDYAERLRICEAATNKTQLEASMFALVEVSADLPAAEQAARRRANDRFTDMRHQRRLEGNRRAARRSRLARETRLRDAEEEAARLRAEFAAACVERDALAAYLPPRLLGLVRALAEQLRRERGLLGPEPQLQQQQVAAAAALPVDNNGEAERLPLPHGTGGVPAVTSRLTAIGVVGGTTTVRSPLVLPSVEPAWAASPDPAPEAQAPRPSLLASLITLPPRPPTDNRK